jgi:hypothetical protein
VQRVQEIEMSNARLGSDATEGAATHVINLLKEALAIIDGWNLPNLGARLQEVIEAVEQAMPL